MTLLPILLATWLEPSSDTALPADTGKAETAFHVGLAAYAAKDYARAVREFQVAYGTDARPDILYAWAQAERLRGNCRGAIPLYERFGAESNSPVAKERAREHLASCRRLQPEPWFHDTLGHVVAASGLALLGVGTAFFAASASDLTQAGRATTYAEYAARYDAAKEERTRAWISVGVGSVLLGAAIAHYTWYANRIPAVTVRSTAGGAMATLAWSWSM